MFGLLEGKRAAVHPDFEDQMCEVNLTKERVTVDGNIITGQALGATIPFALFLIEKIVNKVTADLIREEICY